MIHFLIVSVIFYFIKNLQSVPHEKLTSNSRQM